MKTIKIRGPIVPNNTAGFYDWIGWDCCSPGKVEKALDDAAGDDVTLEINSQGGVCVSGYEIYTMLRGYSGNVTAHVVYAASAATLVACAADKALISDAGIYMIHNTQSSTQGDYRDMDESGDALRQFNEGLLNAYEKKTGMSREDIQSLMDENTYMGPKRAIEYGFIDGYIFEQEGKPNLVQTAVAAEVPIVPEGIAKEVMAMLKNKKVAPGQQKGKEGEENMTLEDFAKQSKEASAELEDLKERMRAEGAMHERERMKALDALEGIVSADDLKDAKYGEKPMDAPALAYQEAMKNKQAAANYMANAISDAKDSGTEDIGIGKVDAGETETNEADEMAAYINKKRGGNR